jgi:hypothetical protein
MADPLGGKLFFYFILALLLAVPASLALLTAYSRSVARGMLARGAGAPTAAASLPAPPAAAGGRTADYLAAEGRLHRRLLLVLGICGAIPALSAALIDLSLQGEEIRLVRVFAYAAAGAALVVPMMRVYLGWSLATGIRNFVLYILACCVLVVGGPLLGRLARGELDFSLASNAWWFLQFLLLTTWLPFLLMIITGMPRLRAIAPLSLLGTLALVLGPALALEWARAAAFGGPGTAVLLTLGLTGTVGLALIPGAALALLAIRVIARLYRDKHFSDLQLLTDSWWLLAMYLGYTQLISAHGKGWLMPLGAAVFVVYRLAVSQGFRSILPLTGLPPNRRLLLLRVFGDTARSEKLFDSLIQRWRFIGSVQLIAGSDLAARTIDPEDLLRFLQGRLRGLFVRDRADLARRLAELDEARDPDGRFRVNEFYCHDDTWQDTLHALLARSDAILMDLRGFRAERAGCRYELEQLAARGLLARTVLLVDDSTDQALLASLLPPAGGRLHPVRGNGVAERDGLFRALLPAG